MKMPQDLKYSEHDEWIRLDADGIHAWVGITAPAVEALSDLVFLDLPEVGKEIQQGEVFGEIESVKAVADLYAPMTGEVVGRNDALIDDLSMLKKDPYGDGWMLKIRVEKRIEADKLMKADAYALRLKSNPDHH
ncbi:MAG: glycine cleavage system protein GcvH [Planctomycetes bacterium]|nr:glycine cleavage system protein GcvH [Planctomycetota bacterium]